MQYHNISLPDEECKTLFDFDKKVKYLIPVPYTPDFDITSLRDEANFCFENGHVVGLSFQTEFLTSIPNSIGNLTELRFIFLHVRIRNLPDTFSKLRKLESFEYILFEENAAKIDFLDKISSCTSLKRFIIRGNFLIYFPPCFSKLTNLEEIHLEDCWYTTQLEIFSKKRRELFDLIKTSNNNVLNLSDLSNCKKLKKLHLHFGPSVLPPWIATLIELRTLSISYNGIPHKILLEDIWKLTNLDELTLDSCDMEELPDEIGHLTQLRKLSTPRNPLKKVSDKIVECQQLEELNLWVHQLDLNFVLYLPHLRELEPITIHTNERIKEHLKKNQLD